MEEKRSYIKGNPEKQGFAQMDRIPVEVEIGISPIKEIEESAFQKPALEKDPKVFFVIISGGQKREKDYFKIISIKDRFRRIKIEFIADPAKLTPDGLYELAKFKKERYASSQNMDAEPDRIYLISDVDHFMVEVIRIKPKCTEERFILIISNSCFEVWLYYAYHKEIPRFTVPTNRLKISSEFKCWLNTEVPGGANPIKAIFEIESNIENAKNNYSEDENGVPKLFSTNMFLLAEDLLPLIEPELDKMKHENIIKKDLFKNK